MRYGRRQPFYSFCRAVALDHGQQVGWPRQAAGVGGEDAIGAVLHGLFNRA
jgi:hypothetical protein